MMEMTNVLIMGKLQARSYARGADRQRTKFTYAMDYRSLCPEHFLFAHALGDRVLINIQEEPVQPSRQRSFSEPISYADATCTSDTASNGNGATQPNKKEG